MKKLEQAFIEFEDKIDELLNNRKRLASENQSLKKQEAELKEERSVLVRKNDLARTRIEAMITRLKNLEQA